MALTSWQYDQRVGLSLDEKVQLTRKRITDWYEFTDGMCYTSFSGGKDSMVVHTLVKEMYPDVPSVYVDTHTEYPEARKFTLGFADEVLQPKMGMREVIDVYGYPIPTKEQAELIHRARVNPEKRQKLTEHRGSFTVKKKWLPLIDAPFEVSHRCCDVLKEKPFAKYEKDSGRSPFLGIRATESRRRKKLYLERSCNAFDAKRKVSWPIAFWTEQDVLRYTLDNDLPLNPMYGDIVCTPKVDGLPFETGNRLYTTGLDRVGCVGCMFGIYGEFSPNRFQRMKKTHPKLWNYYINDLGFGEVLDYVDIPYE